MRKRIKIFTTGFLVLAGCSQSTDEVLESELAQKANLEVVAKAPLTNVQEKENQGKSDMVIVNQPHAIDVVVNKHRKLPEDFEPKKLVEANVKYSAEEGHPKRLLRPEAARALEELFAAAKSVGYDLFAQSGYRSIERQTNLYKYYLKEYGEEWTNKYSAVPGHSEHHTGLAMDITMALEAGGYLGLEQSFGNTVQGQWVAENAHKYGFVIRYPKGKSDITGYSYEPWHLRYFGKELATKIYKSGLTVEEYFGFTN